MDELIRNLGPPVGVWLIALLGWWDIGACTGNDRHATPPNRRERAVS